MTLSTSLPELLASGREQRFTLEEMETWGRAVGSALPRRSVVTLTGDLGAGKTTLARAVSAGAGVFDVAAVTSPTFAIMHQYPAPNGMVVHADLYRLKADSDLDALGWDEIVETTNLLLVEWPERVTRGWPAGTIDVALASDSADSRRVHCTIRR